MARDPIGSREQQRDAGHQAQRRRRTARGISRREAAAMARARAAETIILYSPTGAVTRVPKVQATYYLSHGYTTSRPVQRPEGYLGDWPTGSSPTGLTGGDPSRYLGELPSRKQMPPVGEPIGFKQQDPLDIGITSTARNNADAVLKAYQAALAEGADASQAYWEAVRRLQMSEANGGSLMDEDEAMAFMGRQPLAEQPGADIPDFSLPGGGGFGGFGGGGGPQYIGPDEGLVRDFVKSRLVALVGRADEKRIDALTALYLKDDKRAFKGASVDPKQSVTEKIRSYGDYKRIHELRPDSANEDTWISQQSQALIGGGATAGEADELAATFAQIGANPTQAGQQGATRRIGGARSSTPAFFRDLSNATYRALGAVR